MNTRVVKRVGLAGLCGGLAEVLWVALYASLTSTSGIEVARQVAVTVFPAAADLAAAPVLGVALHLLLSLALGAIFAWAVWIPFARRLDFPAALMTAIAALLAVWAVNFLIILPVLNPGFGALMPYGASLISKALFGVAMAWVLEYGQERRRHRPSTGTVQGVAGWGLSARR